MNTYKIFFRGHFKKHFHDRDQALNWIEQALKSGSLHPEDFEILDKSDNL